MPINQTEDKEYIFQQTFMGASIVNFNANMGFNSNSSSININLVEDNRNTRTPNAMDEGYHIWDKEKGFPDGGTPNYKSAGDIFYSPVVGSPGYFTYYKSKIKNCGECGAETGEFGTFVSIDNMGAPTYINFEDPPEGGYDEETCITKEYDWVRYEVGSDGKSFVKKTTHNFIWKGPPNENKLKEERAGNIESIFEFNGIVKNFKRDVGQNGIRYQVVLEDPRLMLEGTQVVLDSFESPTRPADASYNVITKFNAGTGRGVKEYKNRGYYKYGAIGYYNILNPFGYYEWSQFGSSDTNKNGMSWVKILDALATILKGKYDLWTDPEDGKEYNLERFGGPLYYVQDTREDQILKANEPVNVHRYQVDLSEMYNLHTSQGGPLGDDFRIKADNMTLLTLLQQICETAGADFFVELVVKKEDGIDPIAEKKQHKNSDCSGIIKVTPIPRNAKIIPGQIQKEIDEATAQSKLTEEEESDCTQGTATHQWAKRIVSHNMGYEFKDPVSGVMLVGGPRTRVVGVTAMGWWPNIKGGMIRKRFAVGNDKLKEFLPSIELDGVTFSNPGWYHPHHLPDAERANPEPSCADCPGSEFFKNQGLSVDQVNPITGAMWNVRNPFDPVSNDDTIAWQHALTAAPIMRNIYTGLSQLNDIPHVPAPFQLIGISPLGDGMIDLYPCWGYLKGIDQFKGPFKTSKFLAPKNDGIPIKGRYNDDDAYRDFDTNDGIFTIFEYYNPDYGADLTAKGKQGQEINLDGPQAKGRMPCFFTPYASNCPASEIPKNPAFKSDRVSSTGHNETFRYKFASKTYDGRASVYVPSQCCRGANPGVFDPNCAVLDSDDADFGKARLCGNPNHKKLLSWTWVTPNTATIPVNLFGLGWNSGPYGNNGDFSHFYHVTVTELRMAISGYQSWKEYTQIWAPWIHCNLGLPTCPMLQDNKFGRNLMGGETDDEWALAIAGKKEIDMAHKEVFPVVHHFNRWLGVIPPLKGDEDHDGRGDIGEAAGKIDLPGFDDMNKKLDYLLQKVYERVKEVADNFYGKKYLMALPFTPPDPSQHIRRVSEVAFEYEQRWNTADAGWVDVDFTTAEIGKRYPHNINFYNSQGNLHPFILHPTIETKRIQKTGNRIFIEGEENPESASKTMHFTTYADSVGGGSLGKTFVRSSVAKETHWLWNTSTYDIQTNRAKSGTIKPYALIDVSSTAFYGEDDLLEFMSSSYPQQLHEAAVESESPLKGGTDPKRDPWAWVGVPLRQMDGRHLFNANFLYNHLTRRIFHKGWNIKDAKKAKADNQRMVLAKAYHKPWAAAVPQVSTRYKWGPWALGTGFGKAVYQVDNSFTPSTFGSFDNMEIAGIERCKASVEPDQVTSGWAIEKGTIVLAGLPSPKDGDGSSRGIMGRQLMGQGPYITDVAIDISTGGITTTYNMQTQRKFGKLPEIYENRMRQQASDLVKTMKEVAEINSIIPL